MIPGAQQVDCNGCTLCCREQMVILVPGDFPLSEVDTIDVQNPFGDEPVTKVLKHRADGACIYLGMHGCTVYAKRPAMCRSFSCIGLVRKFAAANRSQLRKLVKAGHVSPAVWNAGARRVGHEVRL